MAPREGGEPQVDAIGSVIDQSITVRNCYGTASIRSARAMANS